MAGEYKIKARVRVSKEAIKGYSEAMRLGWILDVVEGPEGVVYELGLSLPNARGTKLLLPAEQIEWVSSTS